MFGEYLRSISSDAVEMQPSRAITLGRVAGHSRGSAYGHTPTPAANTDVWEGAGLYPFLSAASILEVLSSSANDTAAGTGARTFTINGLDGNFNPVSEVVTLNGVTPVQTVKSYLRVNSFAIASAGSGNVNAGDVTLRVTGAGSTQAIARALYGFSKSAIYTVPTGFTLLINDLFFAVAGNGSATNVVFSFTRIGPTGLITTTNEYNANPSAPVQRLPDMGGPIVQQTSLTTRITSVGGSPTGAYAAFEGILVDNTQLT
jgi:hypothetical protein